MINTSNPKYKNSYLHITIIGGKTHILCVFSPNLFFVPNPLSGNNDIVCGYYSGNITHEISLCKDIMCILLYKQKGAKVICLSR